MKFNYLGKEYNLDKSQFNKFLEENKLKVKNGKLYTRVNSVEDSIKIGTYLGEYIDIELRKYLKDKFNIENSTLHFEFEKVAKRAIFFKKKVYILKLIYKNGKYIDKIDYKGVAAKKYDTSDYAKKHLKIIYDLIISGEIEDIEEAIEKFRNNIDKVPVEDIGTPISINKKIENYDKTIPIHVRGAKIWQEKFAVGDLNFETLNKGKLYIVKNNFSDDKKNSVISIPEGAKIPKGIIIDYEKMREKEVEKRLKNILDILQISKVRKNLNKYINYSENELKDLLYDEIIEKINNELWFQQLNKISNERKFIKYVESSYQKLIYDLFCIQKHIEGDFIKFCVDKKIKRKEVNNFFK